MSVHSSDQISDETRREFADEFRKMQKTAHRLLDHLTAISGYTQIVHARAGEQHSLAEVTNILKAVERCAGILRTCILNLKDFERRLS